MIDQRYREFLLNEIIRGYLLNRQIPTASQLITTLNEKLQEFPDQKRPWLTFLSESLPALEHQVSSARMVNQHFNAARQDLEVLQAECDALEQEQMRLFLRNLQEIRMLQRRLRQLEHQLQSQILVHRETVGYGVCVADNFSDASLIDLQRTTAGINLETHCITLGSGSETFLSYPLQHLSPDDLEIFILTKSGLVHSSLNLHEFYKAVSSGDEAWRMQLWYEQFNQAVIIEIRIKLAAMPVSLNRLIFRHHNYSPYKTRLEVMLSLDKYNWQTVGDGFLGEVADVYFNTTEGQWLCLRLTKENYDFQQGTLFVYEFGCSGLQLQRRSYHTLSSEFYSKPLTPHPPITFNQVSLEVCDQQPAGTRIDYYLSFDGGQTFSAISPLGREQPDTPTLIHLDQVVSTTSARFGVDIATGYHYQSPQQVLLGHVLPDNFIASSIQLWRNVGTKGKLTPVRHGLSGWGIDGQYYVCAIKITNLDGLTLNLGSTTMEVNGIPRTGSIHLAPGVYYIRSNQAFWSHLYDHSGRMMTHFTQVRENGDGTFTGKRADGFQITVRDPLYPFNHKLLIEGLDYNPVEAYGRALTYTGVELFAEAIMIPTSEVNLTHHPECMDLKHFALVQIPRAGGMEWRFLVRYAPTTDNRHDRFDHEVFLAFYQLSHPATANTIVFKAVLQREPDTEISPSLYYYIVKLAN